jgi:cation diffusion facilitator family transporter
MTEKNAHRLRILGGLVSLVLGASIMGVKFWGFAMTGSAAVLSDAMESIVNVVAAGFALWVLTFSARPADRNHPYGHGKMEFVSAVFEGGLITFAAALIIYEAARSLVRGPDLHQLDLGLLVVGGAGLVNAALGFFLIRLGRRTHSITLVADGQHVLSDFWTSAGVVVGLALVRWTGVVWLDPVVAILVALNLAWTGIRLVRRAGGGLVDEEDPALIRQLLEAFERTAHPGIIRLHHLRAIRAGSSAHVDAHLVVPEFWTVDRADHLVEEFQEKMARGLPADSEVIFHTDPCHRLYCPVCDVEACPVRRAPFTGRDPLTAEEAVRPDPPRTFLDPVGRGDSDPGAQRTGTPA